MINASTLSLQLGDREDRGENVLLQCNEVMSWVPASSLPHTSLLAGTTENASGACETILLEEVENC